MNAVPATQASVPAAGAQPSAPARRVLTLRESVAAMLRLASGSAGAQAVQFVSALVLARLLAPAVFGDYAVFIGYGTILTAVGGLKLEQAIQLQASDAGARAFGRAALLVGGLVTASLSLPVTAAGLGGLLPGGHGWHGDWTLALPAYAWLGIAFNTATAWHIRRGRFALVARLRWMIAGGTAAGQIAAAIGRLGLAGQVWGCVLGTLAGFAAAHAGLARAKWSQRAAGGEAAAAPGLVACLTAWRPHGVNLVLAGLASTAAWQIPPVLVREYWGAAAAGFYILAFRLSSAPLALVQSAISDVAYRETTIRLQTGSGLVAYVRRSTLALSILSVVIAAAVTLATPWGVPVVLGPNWGWVVSLLPWMMLSFVFRITGGTISLFTQTGHTRLLLAWQLALLLAHLACFWGAHRAGLGLLGVTIAAVAIHCVFYLVLALANLVLALLSARAGLVRPPEPAAGD